MHMYSEKYNVISTDVDANLEMRIAVLTRYMQDVATAQVDKLHFGHEDLVKDNNIWVVARMQMKINRLPKLGEEIVIATHPGETKTFMFPRYFMVYDKHKNLLVSVSSIWVVTNYATRKIVLRPFANRSLPAESHKDDLSLPERISGTESATQLVDQRKTRYSEMDMNGHINNTHYIDYILDTHNFDFYKRNRITGIEINYEKEILNDSVVDIFTNEENPEIIVGKIDDKASFSARISYEER